MYLLVIAGAALPPLLMFYLRRQPYAPLFDLLAALSVLVANISAGMSVVDTKLHGTEFTTHVHEIFMDPFFLSATGYIGVYAVYRLLLTFAHSYEHRGQRT
jgi:hypothetical protein